LPETGAYAGDADADRQLPRQFLVLGELKRRKRMRDDYNRQQNADMKTVAEEVVTAAGAPQEGIMQMARSLNPNTNMAQDTGLAQATPVTPTQAPQPQAPQMMSSGGIMRMASGGRFGTDIEYNYKTFLQENNLNDTPYAQDMFARLKETMDDRYDADGPNSNPLLFGNAIGFEGSPEGLASVSSQVDDFMPISGSGLSEAPFELTRPESSLSPQPLNASSWASDAAFTPQTSPEDAGELGGGSFGGFEPLSYDALLAKARSGYRVTESDLVALAEAGGLNDNQAAEINAMIADPSYIPSVDAQRISNLPRQNITLADPWAYDPDLVGPRIISGVGDWLGGVFGGRTLIEQDAINAKREEEKAAFDSREGSPSQIAAAIADETALRNREKASENAGKALDAKREEETVSDATRRAADAVLQAADSMFGTDITSIGGRGASPRGAAKTPPADTDTSTSVGSSGRIAQMLEDRQKSAESDKWMALAQTGMALMASKNPTLGGALGEAGLAGIGALQQSRQGMQDFEMDMLKLQTQIDAANRKSSSKGGMTAGNAITLVRNLQSYKGDLRGEIEKLNDFGSTLSPEEKAQRLKGLQSEMLRLDLRIGGLMQSLDGGATPAFDVTGGS
jgi:hypothetical protein